MDSSSLGSSGRVALCTDAGETVLGGFRGCLAEVLAVADRSLFPGHIRVDGYGIDQWLRRGKESDKLASIGEVNFAHRRTQAKLTAFCI